MKISESWLKEWVSTRLDAKAIGDELTSAGLEVETIESAGPLFKKNSILVGKILTTEPHPQADRLKICQVDVGKKKPLGIVCGASNAAKGIKVPVALVKAKVAGMEIKRSEIRGIESHGMLCSGSELGLEDQSSGLLVLDNHAPIGGEFQTYMDLQDKVIEVDLTPNRGDCLSMSGIAREVSVFTGSKLKAQNIKKVSAKNKIALKVELQAPESCPRYVGRAISNIDMSAPTPNWMAERIRRSGSRSINAIVDVTNYVMLELGQPMHAFDLDRIQDGIVVRMAKKNEKLKLLDGSDVVLDKDNLVIADRKKAIALAGIMGGDNSAISDGTSNIYLEAAFFSPSAIIGKARKFGMHTDASHRFERGVDSELQLVAIERATQLILSICGGEPGPVTHAVERKQLPRKKNIRFDKDQIARILGVQIPTNTTTALLKRLGMKVDMTSSGWKVVPPSWRYDIDGQHDLVEEVGRCYGIDKIEPRMPQSVAKNGRHPEAQIQDYGVKQKLIERGYFEAITYSFVDPASQQQLFGKTKSIKLVNPISDTMSVMRHSMWPGLLEAVKSNLNHQETGIRLFEIGNVFSKGSKTAPYREVKKLAAMISGPIESKHWSEDQREADFFDLKGDLESLLEMSGMKAQLHIGPGSHNALHPGQCGTVHLGQKVIGHIGKLHPSQQKALDIGQPVFLFELDLSPLEVANIPKFADISKFPMVQRDLSILVDREIDAQKLLDLVRETGGKLLKKLELFDVYQGEHIEKNKKSFAFSLTFQSESSNLTSPEVDLITENVINALKEQYGAALRT
ncbi:MAG: phenylalanine--tRNA ligase subunit beta [Gammaproteobacteria bacterium]|nr:phenylalanine--tRNA ligase subunit beta [Gammaproteobacteria bacterium]